MFADPGVARRVAGTVAKSMAGLPIGFADVGGSAAMYEVAREVVLLLPTHCTTEQAAKLVGIVRLELASISRIKVALPASAVVGFGDGGIFGITLEFPGKNVSAGCGRFDAGDVIVNESLLDVPAELETETAAEFEVAVSMGRIVAVS
jgi:hypothetical protein